MRLSVCSELLPRLIPIHDSALTSTTRSLALYLILVSVMTSARCPAPVQEGGEVDEAEGAQMMGGSRFMVTEVVKPEPLTALIANVLSGKASKTMVGSEGRRAS